MKDPTIVGSSHDGDPEPANDSTARHAEADADELDQLLDRIAGDFPANGMNSGWRPALRRIGAADASTPDPDAVFVRSLRARLTEPASISTSSKPSAHRLGIVAAPRAELPQTPLAWAETRARRRVLTAIAALAAVLLGLVQFEPSWLDGTSNSFGVPTALASSTVDQSPATPTPTGVPTAASFDPEIETGTNTR